jgi:general secretion pathway protein H
MRSRQDGFTLVELLAVLIVLAILTGLAATHFGARHGADVLQATAHELASRCRAARAAAIRGASDQTVVIDTEKRLVTVGAGVPLLKIADTISVHSETSVAERRGANVGGVRFFPNGGSTGGRIRLETGRQAYEVRINWLTGRVVVERAL